MFLKTVTVRQLLFLLMFALCSSTVVAQSGRRTAKATPSATPAPEPTPTAKSKPQEKSDLTVILGLDRDAFSSLGYYHSVVLEGCADRLKHASVTVDVSDRDVTRGDAVKRAKGSKDAFVVLLKIATDNSGSGTYGNPNLSDLSIEYVIFAPTTAKVLSSGRSYLASVRKGGVSVPIPGRSNNPMYVEQAFRQAAQDVAERILSALHVPELARP
jgi:hypothetical protein